MVILVDPEDEEQMRRIAPTGAEIIVRTPNIRLTLHGLQYGAFAPLNPVKEKEWPLALLPLKLLAQPGDKGLGDIVERTVGPVGGDAYKAWYLKIFGRPCGCTKRKDALNQRFPIALTNPVETT